MKSTFLFPAALRKIGWLLFAPALVAAIVLRVTGYDFNSDPGLKVFAVAANELFSESAAFTVIENNFTDELLLIMIIVGGILAGFSRLRHEDELTANIRYESLVYAVYLNFAIMLAATLFVYGTYYLDVMIANLFTLLFFFLLRFHLMLYRLNKIPSDDQ